MPRSRKIPVFDGHNDTLLHLAIKSPGTESDFFSGREGHIDLPKAKEGGLAGGMFAMFAPSKNWKKEIRWREKGSDGPVMKTNSPRVAGSAVRAAISFHAAGRCSTSRSAVATTKQTGGR